MIVQVNKAFLLFAENQIIDTDKYNLGDIAELLENNVVSLVYDYTEKVDEVSDDFTYYGKTYMGALSSDEVWTITKTTKTGTVTTRDVFHNKSWDNRAIL